jgi:hypothetical protein
LALIAAFFPCRVFPLLWLKGGERMNHGKRGTQQNAIKHGIFAKGLCSGPGFEEESEDFLRFVSDVTESIRPTNGLERILVQKIALLFLRLRRVYKEDQTITLKLFDRLKEDLNGVQSPPDLVFVSREDQALIVRQNLPLDLTMRYETSIAREISRSLDQLEQLRRLHGIETKFATDSLEPSHAGFSGAAPKIKAD